MPMSDVNFDKYSSCMSWQVLNKNRGRLTEPVVFFIDHYIHMSFLFNSVLYFPHNYCIVKEEKGNRCDLKQINYN